MKPLIKQSQVSDGSTAEGAHPNRATNRYIRATIRLRPADWRRVERAEHVLPCDWRALSHCPGIVAHARRARRLYIRAGLACRPLEQYHPIDVHVTTSAVVSTRCTRVPVVRGGGSAVGGGMFR